MSPLCETSAMPFVPWAKAGVDYPAARMQRPSKIELGAVGKGVFDAVNVEILVDVWAAIMPAADRLGLHRPGIFHPAALVDAVDVEIAEAAAAGPEEAMEASDLVGDFGDVGRLGGDCIEPRDRACGSRASG